MKLNVITVAERAVLDYQMIWPRRNLYRKMQPLKRSSRKRNEKCEIKNNKCDWKYMARIHCHNYSNYIPTWIIHSSQSRVNTLCGNLSSTQFIISLWKLYMRLCKTQLEYLLISRLSDPDGNQLQADNSKALIKWIYFIETQTSNCGSWIWAMQTQFDWLIETVGQLRHLNDLKRSNKQTK